MKKMLSVRIESELIERLKDIAYWVPGITMSSFVETTLEEVIKQFEDIKKRPTKKHME